MADNVRVHKLPVQDEIEAWDKFAAAALSGICSNQTVTDSVAADVAARFADHLLIQRRVRLAELQKAAKEKSKASVENLKL